MSKQQTPVADALGFLELSEIADAWIIYDYPKSNPIFWALIDKLIPTLTPEHVTRPVFLVLPKEKHLGF